MTHTLTRKWIAVAIIWAGVLIITFMNTQVIGQIRHHLTSVETLEKDEAFLRANFDKITRDLELHAALNKPIDSLQIELISIENRLKSLAEKEHLTEFDMDSDATAQQTNRVPIEIFIVGDFKDIIFWLLTVEKDMTYLRITGIQMAKRMDSEAYGYSVELDFWFEISTTAAQLTQG